MAKRVKIGDIMQILTSEGISYAQVTHKNPRYGYLIMVFPGTYPKTPKDFNSVVDQRPQFSAFFPVQQAVNQGLFAIVANVAVSDRNALFPIFRSGLRGKDGKIMGSWWLWDGETETRLDRPLTNEEKNIQLEAYRVGPSSSNESKRGTGRKLTTYEVF